ncbi:hypothetical protein ACJJTC_014186 [Scirpophaga incertulas]
MNKFYKHFILCGDADYHCILCQENFHYISDVEKHMRWENHRKALKTQTYFPRFRRDFIYKLEDSNLYYCEVCNLIIPTLSDVPSHINGCEHKHNKANPITDNDIENSKCKYDCGFVIVYNIIVTAQQWHSIYMRKCIMCSENLLDAMDHINSPRHVLKLISSRVIMRNKSDYYRMINAEFFYCFTCKKAVAYENFEDHWSGEEHKNNKPISLTNVTTLSPNSNEDKKRELSRKLIETQRDYFDIDLATLGATCKECKVIVYLDFKVMLEHRKSHKNSQMEAKEEKPEYPVQSSSDEEEQEEVAYQTVVDHGKRRSELSQFGKLQYIRLNPGGGRGYCSLCHATLSASMKVFKEHVRGACHKGHLEIKGIRKSREHSIPSAKTMTLMDFLEIIYYSRSMRVMYINRSFCVDVPGFLFVSRVVKDPHYLKTKCFACDVFYPTGKDETHYRSLEHKKNFLAAKVLIIKDEFVREVRPDIYHCGMCNQAYAFWEHMAKHLTSTKHIKRKNNSNVVQQLVEQWSKENVFIKSSGHPDVLYLQLMCLGIFL